MSFVYNPNIPAADHNPSNDQGPMQQNFASIESWTEVDHFGFGTGQDGWHNIMHIPSQGSDPGLLGTAGQLYSKVVSGAIELFYEDNLGNVTQITRKGGTYPVSQAAVNFNVGLDPLYVIVINTSYNIASVVRNSAGRYTITYTTPLPSFYYVSIASSGSDSHHLGVLVSYNTISTNSIKLDFINASTGLAADPFNASFMASV